MPINVTDLYNRRETGLWNRVAIGDILERITWRSPDKTAIIGRPGAYASDDFAELTYQQAYQATNRIANGLLSQGLTRGDIVMMLCENSVEGWLIKLGIARAGLVSAPVNTMMAPDVVGQLVDLVEPKAIVVDAASWPGVEAELSKRDLAPLVTIPIGGDVPQGSTTLTEFIADMPTSDPDVEIHGDDIWQILFTSGTTSSPKAVMISHSSSYFAALNFSNIHTRGLKRPSDLVLCAFLPLFYHIGDQPFNTAALLCGGTVVLGRSPRPESIAEAIAENGATSLWSGSPAMLNEISLVLDAREDLDISSLTVAVYGWAALHPQVLAKLKGRAADGFQSVAIFGQTEAIACHTFWPDEWTDLYESTAPAINYVGTPTPLLASTIVSPFGDLITMSEEGPGEAVYRSPTVCSGYYRDEAATEEAFADGWFRSGDSCAIGEFGQRIMVDRYKDIVKSGGENVSTIRVESILHSHPGIERAAVVGLPHERWGEAVTALVLRRPGADITEDDLITFAREKLAGFETPKSIVFVDSLPQTVGGKILKYKLRSQYSGLYTD